MITKYIGIVSCLALTSACVSGMDGAQLRVAFDELYSPTIDTTARFEISDVTLEHTDFVLHLDSGTFYSFKPILLDTVEQVAGGFFIGRGRLLFHPTPRLERHQLKRHFDTESLDQHIESVELFFAPSFYEKITATGQLVEAPLHKDTAKKFEELHDQLVYHDDRTYTLFTLRNLTENWNKPYLMVNSKFGTRDGVIYRFDPCRREEVLFDKRFWEFGGQSIENVCSYYSLADSTFGNMNGIVRDQIYARNYLINASIDQSGRYRGRTDMTFDVLRSGTQLLEMELHPELEIDSIIDNNGEPVQFFRWENKYVKTLPVQLILNQPLASGDSATLSFFYQGKIAESTVGIFYVDAGAFWYPRYGFRQRATFDMTFAVRKDKTFIASGKKTDEYIDDKELVTRWVVDEPTPNVSFNIGTMEKYSVESENGTSVDVYFSEKLHNEFINTNMDILKADTTNAMDLITFGSHMERHIAGDVSNSLKLFSAYWGNPGFDRIKATEIIALHGEAFPGFLQLGIITWLKTDNYGYQRMFRSHEVAHQWWGNGVGYETYHDKWLSEGFATYSSWMYLQAIEENNYYARLEEYRKDIFSARKYLFHSGKESGPIAMGPRTHSTQTPGDFELIIYKKGAFVLHMLRHMMMDYSSMSDATFIAMMREFYETYNGLNATTTDFKRMVDKYAGMDMTWFFDQWVYGNDLPTYKFSYEILQTESGIYTADCVVKTENVDSNFRMYLPVEIEFEGKKKAYVRILVEGVVSEFALPEFAEKPKKIRLNPFEAVLCKVKQ